MIRGHLAIFDDDSFAVVFVDIASASFFSRVKEEDQLWDVNASDDAGPER